VPPQGDRLVTGLCPKGHQAGRTISGKWRCPECERVNARRRDQLLGDAARHLGLTRDEYAALHGKSMGAAQRVLAGPPGEPRPDTCRRGHPRTPENTGHKRAGDGFTRYCTACRRDRDAETGAAIADAADHAGVSASEWIRRHGTVTAAAAAGRAARGTEPERRPAVSAIGARAERARQARAQVRAEAEAARTHVVSLDPDQRDWDGLSILAICSCGWRETHATPDRARAALRDHTAERPDAAHVRGDRLDQYRQVSA
jgi:hypothetical protein